MADIITDIINPLKQRISLWRIIKALPFEGGPSSTKWVFLAGTGVVCLGFLEIATAFAWTYYHSPEHKADVIVAGVITGLATIIVGFSVNSVNQRRSVAAQAGTDTTTIADTPLTNETVKIEPAQ